ncbi:DUF2235 domain-containing protein [Pseudoroseicyclus tamaricis]|uniref:DUF2235 domain-containing protein n=1 Tax=Pseudoroseicyclus tamaricis TaxID=2705421 RepID=UPI002E27D4D1|nr:DUF2235 domain-containing protein [Pseudoroseicyclus tamaricis]
MLDGTMSSLREGYESNAGLTFKLLREAGRGEVHLWYAAGIQWSDWSRTWDVLTGRGIETQIARAYGVLAGRYRPGDRIVLIGFSRGAFAARSLAGMIGAVGLLRPEAATVRHVRQAWRHYRAGGESAAAGAFRQHLCHPEVEIEALALWDSVKSLGFGNADAHSFHRLGVAPHIRRAWHALALDETREAYHPVLIAEDESYPGELEQVWFRGSHGDVGGQLDGYAPARPLANIPLVWMLEKLEGQGLPLPEGWRERFPTDPAAPALGQNRGWGKALLHRRRRVALTGPSEHLHPTATLPPPASGWWASRKRAAAQGLQPGE